MSNVSIFPFFKNYFGFRGFIVRMNELAGEPFLVAPPVASPPQSEPPAGWVRGGIPVVPLFTPLEVVL